MRRSYVNLSAYRVRRDFIVFDFNYYYYIYFNYYSFIYFIYILYFSRLYDGFSTALELRCSDDPSPLDSTNSPTLAKPGRPSIFFASA